MSLEHAPGAQSLVGIGLYSFEWLSLRDILIVFPFANYLSAERAAQECFKVVFGGPEGASECPEVASELVRDIFEFFDLFFQGKEIIMRKN